MRRYWAGLLVVAIALSAAAGVAHATGSTAPSNWALSGSNGNSMTPSGGFNNCGPAPSFCAPPVPFGYPVTIRFSIGPNDQFSPVPTGTVHFVDTNVFP